jgi:hypothetical protein
MRARKRQRVEILSRVAREELTLVKAAELMGVEYRQAKRLWAGAESACSATPQGAGVGTLSREVQRIFAGDQELPWSPVRAAAPPWPAAPPRGPTGSTPLRAT